MANEPEPGPKYRKVIEKPDDRNKAGDQLHGAEEITYGARSYRAGVPGCTRVLENQPDDTYFTSEGLPALSPRLVRFKETAAAVLLVIPHRWRRPGHVRIGHLGFHRFHLGGVDF